jgi:hypothetical protein
MATTWPLVSARLTSLTVAQGYALSREPFSFDLQPDTHLEDVCRVVGSLDGYEGYLGGDQLERWTLTVWLARKSKTDPYAAKRALELSISSLTAAVATDETAGDYHVGEDVSADVQLPGDDLGYVVARVALPIELERDL